MTATAVLERRGLLGLTRFVLLLLVFVLLHLVRRPLVLVALVLESAAARADRALTAAVATRDEVVRGD